MWCGHRRRGAVVDVQARVQRLEGNVFVWPGRDLRVLAAAVAAGHRVQVDRVHRLAVLRVGQRQFHGVAFLDAQHRARHLAGEGPVGEGRAVVELAVQLDRLDRVLHQLRRARAQRLRHGVRVHGDAHRLGRRRSDRLGAVGSGGGSRRDAPAPCRCRRGRVRRAGHLEHAFHADLAVAGDRAEVGELARLRQLEAELDRPAPAVEHARTARSASGTRCRAPRLRRWRW